MDIRRCACIAAAAAWLTACSGSTDNQTFREPAPNAVPSADFTATPTSGKVPLLGVAFDATRSNDTDGVISSYAWDFGDGDAGTGRTTTHDYMTDGAFTVSLVVTDEDGDDSQNSSTATITVNPNEPPVADFTVAPDTPQPSPAAFTFDASASTDPDGQVDQYDWDFGDSQTGTGSATNHTFTNNSIVPAIFIVTLTVTDDSGFTGDTTQNVTVLPSNKAPTARFTGCPITACEPPGTPPFFAPYMVTLLADGSTDEDGTIVQYDWDFGDGNTVRRDVPTDPDFTSQTYTYDKSGTFTVGLTVTDNFGATDSVSDDLTIDNLPPVASFSAVLEPGAAPLTVTFDAANSLDSDGDIARYDWEFGDGNTGTASVDLDSGLIDPDSVAGVGSGDGITADHLYSTIGSSIGTRGLPAPETSSIAVADVDGDGKADVVVGNYLQANHLFLGSDSPLQAVESADITDDLDGTLDIALVDVNGDGRPDLVTANGGIDVVPVPVGEVNKVYLWNVIDGKFDSGVPIVAAELDVSTSVAVAFVDGGNIPDLVIGNALAANKLYLGNGAGGFFPGTEIDAGEIDNTSDIILADMDADGNLDVLAANLDSPNRLYLGDGAGGFASGTDISADIQASAALAAADLDADGDLDVVVGNAGEGEINRYYLNQCDGGCAPGTDVFAGVKVIDITEDQEISTSVDLEDVDGDGDVDLIVGNALEPTRLYVNFPNGTSFGDEIFSERLVDNPSCDPDVEPSCTCDVDAPDTVACAAEAITSGEFLLEGNTSSVLIADIDGNEAPDLFAGSFGGENTVFLSSCNGASGVCMDADSNPYASSFPTVFPDNGVNDVAVGDIDGDGDLDMVTATRDEANQVIMGTANIGFALTRYLAGSEAEDSRDVELADMDGDGDLDLLVGNAGQTNKYYPNTCNGTCAPDTDVFAGPVYDVSSDLANTASISVGDVDGDGDLDLMTGNGLFGNQPNRVFINRCTDAGGCLLDENVFDRSDVNVAFKPLFFDVGGVGDLFNTQGIVMGDLNGDGDLDVVTANADQENYFYENICTPVCAANENPFTVPGVAIDSGSALSSRSVALVDFDNSGVIDLVFGNSGTPNRIYLNTMGAFPSNAGTDVGEDTDLTFSVAAGDINGDGFADIVAGNEGANRLYYGDPGGGTFTSNSVGIDITTDDDGTRVIKIIDIGDLGSDGRLDVVVGNLGAPIRIYYNDGRHIARLTVTDNSGDSSTTAVEIVIP